MSDPERINDPGAKLAADMIDGLRSLRETNEQAIALQAELKESIDKLVDHCEVFCRTMEILADKKDEGKTKFGLSDFADAYLEAADEIMPADDDDGDEDEHGSEDPRVGAER